MGANRSKPRSKAQNIRKTNTSTIKHWLITELGHKGTENIHLHGIIWTNENVREIEKIWGYGFVYIGDKYENGRIENYVNEKTANYITKYVQKVDFDHKEYRPIILTSAGIGGKYLERRDAQSNKYNGEETREYYRTKTGHKIKLTTYWRNKIYNDEEREALWLQKLDKQERWVCGEKVDVSINNEEYYKLLKFYRSRNKQLGYQTNQVDWNRKKYEEDRRTLLLQKR